MNGNARISEFAWDEADARDGDAAEKKLVRDTCDIQKHKYCETKLQRKHRKGKCNRFGYS